MSSDAFQIEAGGYCDEAPELVPMDSSSIVNDELVSSMPDLERLGNGDNMPAEEELPLSDCSSGFGHKCTVCGKRFLNTAWLDKHMVMHVKSEQYSCDKCGAVFSRKNSLYYHQLKEHSEKGPRTVSCKICGKTVGVGGPLTNHLRSHTLSATHSAAQQYKKKLLKSQITNRKPQEILKRNVRSLLKCNFCGKTFDRVSSLSNHLRVHTNEKIPNKKYTSSKTATEDPHTSITEKLLKFQCHICDKKLVNNIALSNHLRSHGLTLATKFKKSKRDITLMAFQRRKPTSAEKIQKDHSSTTTKNQLSGLEGNANANLTKDQPAAVTEGYRYNPNKIYKCKYCGLQFNNKFGMAGHVKVHKSEFEPQTVSSAIADCFSMPSADFEGILTDNHEGEGSIGMLSGQNLSSDGNNVAERLVQPYMSDEYEQYVPLEKVAQFSSNYGSQHVEEFSGEQHVSHEKEAGFANENLAAEESENPITDSNADDFDSPVNDPGANVDEFANPSVLSVKCKTCGVDFDNSVSLALHSRKHKRRSATSHDTYKCMECFTLVASRSGLMRHSLMHTGTQMHNCPECGIQFLQRIHLQRHLTAHQNKFPFTCNLCTATYMEERGLVKHKRMHDDPNWGFVTCAHCKFVFSNTAVLKMHVRARHTGKQNFECNVCRAQFMKNIHVNQHMRLHDIQLEHAGEKRDRSTSSSSSQVKKVKSKKRPKSLKKVYCEICNHPFGYNCSLKVHMRNIHQHFFCGICLKYVDNSYLSTASGMLHKSVCISCYPGKGKKVKPSKIQTVSNLSLKSEKSSVSEFVQVLLAELVDEELLASKGVLGKPVHEQLQAMVEVCGGTSKHYTGEQDVRENVIRLFRLCVGEEATNTLLQSELLETVLCGMLMSLHEV